MDKQIMKRRARAVRAVLKKKRLRCLIVVKPANVTYLTAFSGQDSWAVVAGRGTYLVTDSRYTQQAESECVGCKIIERKGPMAEAVAKLLKKFKSVRTAAVESTASLGVFEALGKAAAVRLKMAKNIVEQLRDKKDAGEIGAVKAGAKIAAKALGAALKKLKTGMTESELAGTLDFHIRKLGARNSFETIVGFGANASRAHHQPGRKKLKKNDTILIDFGVKYKNYCCDITRCFARGKVAGLYKQAYEAVRESQSTAIKMIKDGVKIKAVDSAAREVIDGFGLPVYGHGTGHGLGLEVHEGPVVTAETKGKLQAGQIITIEPGVYIPGKFGIRIEDDILVTKTGCRVLSQNLKYKSLTVL